MKAAFSLDSIFHFIMEPLLSFLLKFDLLCFFLARITGSGNVKVVWGSFSFEFEPVKENGFLSLPPMLKYALFFFPILINIIILFFVGFIFRGGGVKEIALRLLVALLDE